MFNCPVWLLEGNWVYHEGIYNQYSIVVGGTIDQLVAGCSWGGLPTTNHVWGWNQQPMRIINQWKFCQQEDVLLRRWLVFQIQGFLPSTRSSNRWAHLAGARRSKKLSVNLQWWLDASSQTSIWAGEVWQKRTPIHELIQYEIPRFRFGGVNFRYGSSLLALKTRTSCHL